MWPPLVKVEQFDYITKIVYPAFIILLIALALVIVTELYIRRQDRLQQKRFHKLNDDALKQAEKDLLIRGWALTKLIFSNYQKSKIVNVLCSK